MQESFILKGYKNIHIIENAPTQITELMTITREIEDFPDDSELMNFMVIHDLDRCEVVKSYRR